MLSEYDRVCPGQRVLRTPQDRIIAARFEDSYLFEGPLRTQVNPYVLSGNLNVRFTLYRYAAFTAERKSICVTTRDRQHRPDGARRVLIDASRGLPPPVAARWRRRGATLRPLRRRHHLVAPALILLGAGVIGAGGVPQLRRRHHP